jgi:hypothetical protein
MIYIVIDGQFSSTYNRSLAQNIPLLTSKIAKNIAQRQQKGQSGIESKLAQMNSVV